MNNTILAEDSELHALPVTDLKMGNAINLLHPSKSDNEKAYFMEKNNTSGSTTNESYTYSTLTDDGKIISSYY